METRIESVGQLRKLLEQFDDNYMIALNFIDKNGQWYVTSAEIAKVPGDNNMVVIQPSQHHIKQCKKVNDWSNQPLEELKDGCTCFGGYNAICPNHGNGYG